MKKPVMEWVKNAPKEMEKRCQCYADKLKQKKKEKKEDAAI